MPATVAIPAVSGHAPDNEASPACSVCSHPWEAHDPIAARFCTATDIGKFSRGCVCPPTPATPGTT